MNNQPTNLVQLAYKYRFIILISIFLLILLLILSNFGRITITITGDYPSGSKISYKITSQDGGDPKEIISTSNSVSTIIGNGDYEVLVSVDGKGAFKVDSVSGFLLNTDVQIALEDERKREFVGYDSDSCSYYNNDVALSFACIGSTDTMFLHEPSIGRQATYNSDLVNDFGGIIQDVFFFNGKTVALIKEGEFNQRKEHSFYELNKAYKPVKKYPINSLSSSSSYYVQTYENGFALYDFRLGQVFYFDSLDKEPVAVSTPNPSSELFRKINISIGKNSDTLLLYSDAPLDISEEQVKDVQNEFILLKDDSTTRISLDGIYVDQFEFCGTASVCVLNGSILTVYGIDGERLTPSFKISDVESVHRAGSQTFVAKSDALLRLDVDNKAGVLDYNFGGYGFCGIQDSTPEIYLMCLRDSSGRTVLAAININEQIGSNADEIAAIVSSYEEVVDVSLYKDSLIISPNKGKLEPQADGLFGYNQEFVNSVRKSIETKIDTLNPEGVEIIIL